MRPEANPVASPWRPPRLTTAWRCRAAAALAAMGFVGSAWAQGLVQGVLGLPVSPAPGEAPALQLRGGVALRLEQVELDGRVWRQLLASDGSHGWTPLPLGAEVPVTAHAVASGFELLPLPPGHADFLSAVGQPVPDAAVGRLLGGSRESHVADTQDLMLPPWLRTSLAPWPHWSIAGVDGYAPLALVRLAWPGPAAGRTDEKPNAGADVRAAARTSSSAAGRARHALAARDLLGGWGLHGLSRAPFLAPLAAPLQGLAPAAGTAALDLSNAPGKPAGRRVLDGAWQGPLCAYRATSAPQGGLAALLCYGQGKTRAFVVQGSNGNQAVAYADDDGLSVTRLEEADLDGDGLPEWLLEVAGLYGDGYYTELWVIDGRSAKSGLRVQRAALSHSSGEMPGATQLAAWGVGSGRSLWVWRSTAEDSRLSTLRYARGGLKPATTPALVVLGTDSTHVAAQQRRLQALAHAPDAMVLPRQTAAGVNWVTALAGSGHRQALRQAASLALPASQVQSLPWRP